MMMAAGMAAPAQAPTAHHWAIVVHGGAGVIERSQLGPEGDKLAENLRELHEEKLSYSPVTN